MALKILLVGYDDNWQKILPRHIARALRAIGSASDIQPIATFNEALGLLQNENPWHLLVTEIFLEGLDGTEQHLGGELVNLAHDLQVPSIVVSKSADPTDARNALRRDGAFDYFSIFPRFDSQEFVFRVQEALQMGLRYDAFISYSHHDSAWVHDRLLPRLQRERLRVCLDSQNFETGTFVLDNIANAVERSRKILLILTPNWINSE